MSAYLLDLYNRKIEILTKIEEDLCNEFIGQFRSNRLIDLQIEAKTRHDFIGSSIDDFGKNDSKDIIREKEIFDLREENRKELLINEHYGNIVNNKIKANSIKIKKLELKILMLDECNED